MNGDFKKLIKVINSITSYLHIPAVKKYIELYYKKHGTKGKQIIEYHFKVKRKNI